MLFRPWIKHPCRELLPVRSLLQDRRRLGSRPGRSVGAPMLIQPRSPPIRFAPPVNPVPAVEVLPPPVDQIPREEREWLDEDRRPIANMTLNIAPTAGDMPTTFNRRPESETIADERSSLGGYASVISPVRADLCYNPLYFEEPRVERFGQSWGCIQPVMSGVHFFTNAALMPAKMIVHPPRSFVCQDRYYKRNEYLQEHPLQAGATGALQSTFWTGLFLLP